VTGALVEFANKVAGISPDPDVGTIGVTPAGVFLVHANVVPVTALVNTIVMLEVPEQIGCAWGVAVASGMGSTVNVMHSESTGPQPTPLWVM
jgi:hypothetical protein